MTDHEHLDDERAVKLTIESTILADEIQKMFAGMPGAICVAALAQIMAYYFSHHQGEARAEREKIWNECVQHLIAGRDQMRQSANVVAGEDIEVIVTSDMQEQIDKDPEMTSFVRGMSARFRQALDGANFNDLEDIDRRMREMGAKHIDAEDMPEGDREALENALASRRKLS